MISDKQGPSFECTIIYYRKKILLILNQPNKLRHIHIQYCHVTIKLTSILVKDDKKKPARIN